ncbi:hypothetical protein ANO11243_084950 [Dothideomycetidae sp. 11243]|nr:hypothetical protein ANO11243_084950 [fungal sp. No.11243]
MSGTEITRPSVTRPLMATAMSFSIQSLFWHTYLPLDIFTNVDKALGFGRTGNLLNVRSVAASDPTSDLVCRALAFSSVGRLHRDRDLVTHGNRLYGDALRLVRSAMDSPAIVVQDGFLASCRLLSIYEVLRQEQSGESQSQSPDWQRHILGLCQIVRVRGPSRLVENSGLMLFRDVRLLAVRSSMVARKPLVPTDFVRQALMIQLSQQTLEDELFNMMLLNMPALMERSDRLTRKICFCDDAELADVESELMLLIDDQMAFATSLGEFEDRMVMQYSGNGQNDVPRGLPGLTAASGMGLMLLASHYWATSVSLHADMRALTTLIQGKGVSDQLRLHKLPDWINPFEHAANIVQTLPRFYNPEAGIWGLTHGAFPLGIVMRFYTTMCTQSSSVDLLVKSDQVVVVMDFLASFLNSDLVNIRK